MREEQAKIHTFCALFESYHIRQLVWCDPGRNPDLESQTNNETHIEECLKSFVLYRCIGRYLERIDTIALPYKFVQGIGWEFYISKLISDKTHINDGMSAIGKELE